MIVLHNPEGLIGDVLGTVPIMIDLAKQNGGLKVMAHHEADWLYPLIAHHGIERIHETSVVNAELDIQEAFRFSQENGTYMGQSWHNQFGLPTPPAAPPDLEIPDVEVPIYDYIFAPFSRSTPDNQKWVVGRWFQLARKLVQDGNSICVFGNSKFDSPILGMVNEFDRPMIEVLNILKKCRKGCVSINTGISHLCYATGTKNYLLNNQGQGWSVQPDAISIETYIPRITVDEMLDFIKNN